MQVKQPKKHFLEDSLAFTNKLSNTTAKGKKLQVLNSLTSFNFKAMTDKEKRLNKEVLKHRRNGKTIENAVTKAIGINFNKDTQNNDLKQSVINSLSIQKTDNLTSIQSESFKVQFYFIVLTSCNF